MLHLLFCSFMDPEFLLNWMHFKLNHETSKSSHFRFSVDFCLLLFGILVHQNLIHFLLYRYYNIFCCSNNIQVCYFSIWGNFLNCIANIEQWSFCSICQKSVLPGRFVMEKHKLGREEVVLVWVFADEFLGKSSF